jgi:hypothetical protein
MAEISRRNFLKVVPLAGAVALASGCEPGGRPGGNPGGTREGDIYIDVGGDVILALGAVVAGTGAVPVGVVMILVGGALKLVVKLNNNSERTYQRQLSAVELERLQGKDEVEVKITEQNPNVGPNAKVEMTPVFSEKVKLQRE